MLLEEGSHDPYGAFLYVDAKGNRFMDESRYWFDRTRILYDMEGSMFYTITDAKVLDTIAQVEVAVEKGAGFKADTVEELAALIDVDVATLQKTIDSYNAVIDKGSDDEFGKDISKFTSIDQGPFYALTTTFNSINGSIGGPKINNNCQIIDEEGTIIEGLYAVGELANGELFYKLYPSSGSSISTAIGMGRIAGTHAATSISDGDSSAEATTEKTAA